MTCSAYRHLTNSLPYYSHYHEHHFLYLYLIFDSSFHIFLCEKGEQEWGKNEFVLTAQHFFPPYYIFFKPICSLQAWFPIISVMLLLEDCLFCLIPGSCQCVSRLKRLWCLHALIHYLKSVWASPFMANREVTLLMHPSKNGLINVWDVFCAE